MPKNYDEPSVTVDAIVFAIIDEKLKVLLIERKLPPFKGAKALPGVFLSKGEVGINAASRSLKEKANLINVYLEQLYTFDNPKRDPRGRVITITYFGLLNGAKTKIMPSSKTQNPAFHDVAKLPKTAFDHAKIINYARIRLRNKIQYTNIVSFLLPNQFTFLELQKAYEIISGKKLDKRNFRKKFLALGLIKPTKEMISGVQHRPAELFKFTKEYPQELKRFF